MDDPQRDTLHHTEWDLLEALWELKRATAREVADALREKRGWAYSTVKTLLDRMVEKGTVSRRKVGSVWEYSAAVRAREARRTAWQRFVDMAFGGALDPALRFVATESDLSPEQAAELKKLLDRPEASDE